MNYVEANSMDQIQNLVLSKLLSDGLHVKPRGYKVKELTAFSFKLNNPRARIIYNPERKFNLMFAMGELFWYLRGSNKCDIISFYNRRYPNFSDDGVILYGAYGARIFTKRNHNLIQWNEVFNKLKEDPDTRQAIIQIYSAEDLIKPTKDLPCTCYLQFFIRENKLNLIVNMRSNDIIWGTSYDVFSFTMMQEIMAMQLGVELGTYTHFAGSMHLYERHFEMANNIISNIDFPEYIMPEMPEDPWKGIAKVLEIEEKIRNGQEITTYPTDTYWSEISDIFSVHYNYRIKNWEQVHSKAIKLPTCYSPLVSKYYQSKINS